MSWLEGHPTLHRVLLILYYLACHPGVDRDVWARRFFNAALRLSGLLGESNRKNRSLVRSGAGNSAHTLAPIGALPMANCAGAPIRLLSYLIERFGMMIAARLRC